MMMASTRPKLKIWELRNKGKAKSTKDQTGFQKSSGMKKMVQILKTWLKALIPWRKS